MTYICQCTVHAHDDLFDITARPMELVQANSRQEALERAEQKIFARYKSLGCQVNKITFAFIDKMGS